MQKQKDGEYQKQIQEQYSEKLSESNKDLQSSSFESLCFSSNHFQKLKNKKEAEVLNEEQLKKIDNFFKNQKDENCENQSQQSLQKIKKTKSHQRIKYYYNSYTQTAQQWEKQDLTKYLRSLSFNEKLSIVQLMFGSSLVEKVFSHQALKYDYLLKDIKKQKVLILKIKMVDLPQVKMSKKIEICHYKQNNYERFQQSRMQLPLKSDNSSILYKQIIQKSKNNQLDIQRYRQMYKRVSIILQYLQYTHLKSLRQVAQMNLYLTGLSCNSNGVNIQQAQLQQRVQSKNFHILKQITKQKLVNERAQKLSTRITKIRQMFGKQGDQKVQHFQCGIRKKTTKAYGNEQLQQTNIKISIKLTDKLQQQHKKRKMNQKLHIARKFIYQIVDTCNQVKFQRQQDCLCSLFTLFLFLFTILMLFLQRAIPFRVICQTILQQNYITLTSDNVGYSPAIQSLTNFITAANHFR